MKKLVASVLCACMVSSLLVGCGSDASTGSADSGTSDSSTTTTAEDTGKKSNADPDKVINVWAFTDEVPGMIEKYIEAHPDFG